MPRNVRFVVSTRVILCVCVPVYLGLFYFISSSIFSNEKWRIYDNVERLNVEHLAAVIQFELVLVLVRTLNLVFWWFERYKRMSIRSSVPNQFQCHPSFLQSMLHFMIRCARRLCSCIVMKCSRMFLFTAMLRLVFCNVRSSFQSISLRATKWSQMCRSQLLLTFCMINQFAISIRYRFNVSMMPLDGVVHPQSDVSSASRKSRNDNTLNFGFLVTNTRTHRLKIYGFNHYTLGESAIESSRS